MSTEIIAASSNASENALIIGDQKEKLALLVNTFISDQDVKQNSRELYRRTLNLFLSWINQRDLALAEVTRVHIIEYKESLLNAGMSGLTVNSYITSVRKFFEYLESQKLYPNVAKGVKGTRRKQQFRKQPLTAYQSSTLLTHCESEDLRNYVIINLLIRTGLRTIEVCRANVEDITFKAGKRVLLVHDKGHDEKDDFVILTSKAYEPIEKYLQARPKAKVGEPLFASR